MLTNVRSRRRKLRQARVRKRLRGTDATPRLTVFRSSNHMYAQVVSDESNRTLVAVSTLSPELKGEIAGKGGNKDAAQKVGRLVASKARAAGIETVVFDRNGFLYHGRVRSLAEAAREAGLKF
jgi:large subunit ribosomal protein L18